MYPWKEWSQILIEIYLDNFYSLIFDNIILCVHTLEIMFNSLELYLQTVANCQVIARNQTKNLWNVTNLTTSGSKN